MVETSGQIIFSKMVEKKTFQGCAAVLVLTPNSSSSSSKMLSKSEMLTTRSFSRVSEGLGLAAPSSGPESSGRIDKHLKSDWRRGRRGTKGGGGEGEDDADVPDFGAELKIDIASFPSGSAPLLVISSP